MFYVVVRTNGFDDVYSRTSDFEQAMHQMTLLRERKDVERVYIVSGITHTIIADSTKKGEIK